MRRNTYDERPARSRSRPSARRRSARSPAHYDGLFGTEPSLAKLRDQYAMTEGALPEPADRQALAAFFFWSAWAAATNRPGETELSYTSNWPHEPLVGNTMSTSRRDVVDGQHHPAAGRHRRDAVAARRRQATRKMPTLPEADPLLGAKATPSMKATRKYFFVVIGLMLLQIGMGVITAHYAVEGQAFFGIPLAQILPYVVSRTIHTQIGIFWIATAWLATGLYIAPLLSGHEPKFQKLGVDVLFYALLVIVVGSTATGWLGTLQHRGRRLQLLARQPGPRIHEHGPRLADPAVRRPAVLGLPARPRRCGRR